MSAYDSRFIPKFPDFLMSYSCRHISGDAVYSNIVSASCYIKALNEYLRLGYEIDLALSEVTAKVRKELEGRAEFRVEFRGEDKGENLSKWLPFHRASTTRRRIYL